MPKTITQIRYLPNGDILALDEKLNVAPAVRLNIFDAIGDAAEKAGYTVKGALVESVNLPPVRIVPDLERDCWKAEGA